MDKHTEEKIEKFVEHRIVRFHQDRAAKLAALKLNTLLRAKNPYLFKAKNVESAPMMIEALLSARLSSSEEGSFGNFMESLAVFVAQETSGGQKSTAEGIDIELNRSGIRYLIAVKSGNSWGNSSQHYQLEEYFKTAVRRLRQNKESGPIQPTLGICYGKFKEKYVKDYLHTGGQSFWCLISGETEFYTQIVRPLGHRAEEFNEIFAAEKTRTYNRMTGEFIARYCLSSGQIDWQKLVEFVSKNIAD